VTVFDGELLWRRALHDLLEAIATVLNALISVLAEWVRQR